MDKLYQVLSFYCYTLIENPEQFREEQHFSCLKRNLRGRLKIASEGINGKLSGRKEDCQAYVKDLLSDSRFANTDIKVDEHTGYVSEKLHVRVKSEIVNAGLPYIKPYERTGKYVSPKEFDTMIQEDDVVVVDVRSNYENAVGRFKGAVTFDVGTFREVVQCAPLLEKYREKRIVVTCTGGIKDEKFTAYLLHLGFEKVYQLKGGIINYGKETEGSAFEGSCYVFDNRLTTEINKRNPTVISSCYVCKKPSKRIVNCANMACNLHTPICESCGEELQGACSQECQKSTKKRSYDGTGYYTKQSNGYNPYKDVRRALS